MLSAVPYMLRIYFNPVRPTITVAQRSNQSSTSPSIEFLGHGFVDTIDICAITFLSIYGTILQMTWTLFEGNLFLLLILFIIQMKIILILGIHLHLLLSLSYLPKADHYLSIMIITGWCYPLLLVIGLLIHVSWGYGPYDTVHMARN